MWTGRRYCWLHVPICRHGWGGTAPDISFLVAVQVLSRIAMSQLHDPLGRPSIIFGMYMTIPFLRFLSILAKNGPIGLLKFVGIDLVGCRFISTDGYGLLLLRSSLGQGLDTHSHADFRFGHVTTSSFQARKLQAVANHCLFQNSLVASSEMSSSSMNEGTAMDGK